MFYHLFPLNSIIYLWLHNSMSREILTEVLRVKDPSSTNPATNIMSAQIVEGN